MTYTSPFPPSSGSIRLKESFPHATSAECDRFDRAFQRKASHHLKAYLCWRSEHGMDNHNENDNNNETSSGRVDSGHVGSDELHWIQATDRAFTHIGVKEANEKTKKSNMQNRDGASSPSPKESENASQSSSLSASSSRKSPLVQFVRCHWVEADVSYLKDKSGHRILHLLPAQISLKDAAIESYVLALSFYLERKFHRENEEQLTLLIDVRAGKGWPNPPASQMVTFVRRVSTVLSQHFPSRLHRCIVYPVPRAALVIWNFMQAFLSPSLRQLMVLIAGSAEIESPPPNEQLEEYVQHEGISLLEEARRESFS